MNAAQSLQRFIKDVKHHEMKVVQDDGVMRHLTFSRPESVNKHFNITTWPGHLCISGDMGCYVFSRVPDMFRFFRDDQVSMGINPGYWEEKLQVGSGAMQDVVSKQWNADKFREAVVEEWREWLRCESLPPPGDTLSIKDDIRRQVLAEADFEEMALMATETFDCSDAPGLLDGFAMENGMRCKTYTPHYIWCCYAIVWAIQQYDAANQEAA